MASFLTTRVQKLWLHLSRFDLLALVIVVLYAGLWILQFLIPGVPQSGFFAFLAILAILYVLVRGILAARKYLLWSLRNRLITAYIFIAVVPVLLLLTMAGLAAYVLYWQLGAYVLHAEIDQREERVAAAAGAMATSFAIEAASGHDIASIVLTQDRPTFLKAAMAELPGLTIQTGANENLLRTADGSERNSFSGLIMDGNVLFLRSVARRPAPGGHLLVTASVPVTPELLDTLASELGPIQFDVRRPERPGDRANPFAGRFTRIQLIGTMQRAIPAGANLFDKLIRGFTTLDVDEQNRNQGPKESNSTSPVVIASFITRPSLLNHRLFGPLGNLSAIITALLVVGGVFLAIEVGSLITGIILTRTITTAVDDLYRATQHVQTGDLMFRVHVPQKDQLGALGESFNSMMQSVSTLIEEQGKRQRLENELSIAHEVQEELFPKHVPEVPGMTLEAICRPARIVSGDYYDFIRISPTRIAIALADISGKGISAALLMANVQAALRSDVLRHRGGPSGNNHAQIHTDAIISHLNHHLFRNTSDERYATCVLAVYDTATSRLTYTNAGHLPPLYITGDHVHKLETGGMVVGLFNDVSYEQAVVEIEPGGLLIAYSDGLVEPENVYGEEFGTDRLVEVALLHRNAEPPVIAEAMMRAAEQWSGSPEQADDMTVIVARLSAAAQPNFV